MEKTTKGVIGGAGKYGRWFQKTFERLKYPVKVSDPMFPNGLTNIQVAEQSDVIVVSVFPMRDVPMVIQEIAPVLREDQLLIGITSIKTFEAKAMLATKAESVAIHPMCSPTVRNWRGQRVVLCEVRLAKWRDWVMEFLKELEANVRVSTPQEHDRYTTVTQGEPHVLNIAGVSTMRELGIDFATSMEFSSPVSRLNLINAGRVLGQNTALITEIQMGNPYILAMIDTLLRVLGRLRQYVAVKDVKGFAAELEACRAYVGEKHLQTSWTLFDSLNSYLVDLGAESDRVISVRTLNDKPGDLLTVLTVLFQEMINLKSLHSCPAGEKSFRFPIQLDRDRGAPEVQRAITQINAIPGFTVES